MELSCYSDALHDVSAKRWSAAQIRTLEPAQEEKICKHAVYLSGGKERKADNMSSEDPPHKLWLHKKKEEKQVSTKRK